VHRYKEDPQIYSNVQMILDRNQKQLDFYSKGYDSFDKLVSSTITNFNRVRKSNRIGAKEVNEKYFEDRKQDANNLLETIDLDDLFH
jgi:hypothetical protein